MKPYETQQDRDNETRVVEALAQQWGVTFQKLPIKYGGDFILLRDGKGVAWVEIKCRKMLSTHKRDIFLNVEKWSKLQTFSRTTRRRFIFAVQFTDGIYWVDETEREREIVWGGRKDRDDPNDTEPVVLIPVKEMKKLRGEHDRAVFEHIV